MIKAKMMISLGVCLCFALPAYTANKVVIIPLFDAGISPAGKLIFATNGTWNGDLDGLKGADEKCNDEASSRSISGTFQALLGSSEEFPLKRSQHYAVPYVSLDNAQLQSDFHKLFNSSGIESPVLTGGLAWMGLAASGAPSPNNCLNWTDSSSGQNGEVGVTDSTGNGNWLDEEPLQCDEYLRLYCIEQ